MKIRVSENHKAAYENFYRRRKNGNEMLFLAVRCSFSSFSNGIIRKMKIHASRITRQHIKTSADAVKMETNCIFKQFVAVLVPLEMELYAKGKFE